MIALMIFVGTALCAVNQIDESEICKLALGEELDLSNHEGFSTEDHSEPMTLDRQSRREELRRDQIVLSYGLRRRSRTPDRIPDEPTGIEAGPARVGCLPMLCRRPSQTTQPKTARKHRRNESFSEKALELFYGVKDKEIPIHETPGVVDAALRFGINPADVPTLDYERLRLIIVDIGKSVESLNSNFRQELCEAVTKPQPRFHLLLTLSALSIGCRRLIVDPLDDWFRLIEARIYQFDIERKRHYRAMIRVKFLDDLVEQMEQFAINPTIADTQWDVLITNLLLEIQYSEENLAGMSTNEGTVTKLVTFQSKPSS